MNRHKLQAIADEYYELLEKPVAANQKPLFAIYMIGLVGAGKSMVRRKPCRRIPMICPSGEEVRKLLFEKRLSSIS